MLTALRIGLTASVAVLAVVLATLGQGSDRPLPPPEPLALWNFLNDPADPYTSWPLFPTQQAPLEQLDEEPHGARITVRVNEIARQSLTHPSNPFEMGYGSIMVKENYSAADQPLKLLSLTVMYKVRGFRTIGGEDEWFWVMYNPDNGEVVQLSDKQPFVQPGAKFESFRDEVVSGKPWFCLSCHKVAREAGEKAYGDYVFKLQAFRASD